jgi:hypothetical protein
MFEKLFKKQLNNNHSILKNISSKLNDFKYRTLNIDKEVITIWKQDSGNIMRLNVKEANQLLIYLQYSNSQVPRYTSKEINKSQPKIEVIRKLAENCDYKEIALQQNPPLISFSKGDIRINVYHTTMSVGTCLKHPKKGKTQLFRKNVSMKQLEVLFKNPRVHTGKGYYAN